ncbi:hypothetical protein EHO57_13765 [Leptospira langatensis]|uniref:Uncharacterized protein n=1 Tax=Leptospira langatensis TaxID=2484983 RepID=A0A5R2ASX3_9LEPT|nr:hypothetical protein [Leptospira langatensis]TGJ99826.1 hypothetical protein EHO57_13765 [Leptospira langatensis]
MAKTTYPIHKTPSEYAGKTVTVKGFPGIEFKVEDWWDRVQLKSWRESTELKEVLNYAVRTPFGNTDDEVLLGTVSNSKVLFHASEIDEVLPLAEQKRKSCPACGNIHEEEYSFFLSGQTVENACRSCWEKHCNNEWHEPEGATG